MFPPDAPPWVEVLEKLWNPGVWVFLASLLVSLLATPVFRWIALRKGICDQPDQAVKIHSRPIPYLGGCAIWLAWTVPLAVYLYWCEPGDGRVGLALLAGGVVAFLTGLLDDLTELRPWLKVFGQACAAVLLLAGGVYWFAYPRLGWLPALNFPPDAWFVWVLCIGMHFLVVIGATNATNLLDGLDGLCSGVSAIVSVGFLLLATSLTAWANPDWFEGAVYYEHTRLIMVVAFALAGASIGFLPYNFNPARVFMGDAGSVFIGYVLAAMMIMFSTRFGMVKWFVGALFIFGLPILDTGLALVRRIVNRRPIMMPDRSHFYNQLVDRLGLSVLGTVGLLYTVSILFAAAGLLVCHPDIPGRYAVAIYAGVGLVFLVVVWRLGFLRMTPEEKAAADRYLAHRRGAPPE
ncbi:MAG TPA: MraY family glycosyltransferase [Phycisphaerae bacterium]|nr:MraY family glycosyltransferase [Phycisphaerae bacterium]